MHCPAGLRSRLVFPSDLDLEEMLSSWKPCTPQEPTGSMEDRPAACHWASKGLNSLEGGLLGYYRAPSLCSGKHSSGNQQASYFGFSSFSWPLLGWSNLMCECSVLLRACRSLPMPTMVATLYQVPGTSSTVTCSLPQSLCHKWGD